MSEWKKTYLRDLIIIKNGKDHKKLKDGQYPVYGSGGIMRYANSYLYDKESVLLPRKGTLNNIQYATEPFWTVDTCYYTEVNEEKVLPYFLYCSLCKMDIETLNTGSAIPSMTFEKYYSIEIPLPPLPTQHRIATILSRYDSLIENYQKQIKLLEEAAQRLYKEWFIDLHFPGYENANIIDGVPEGWEKKKLENFCNVFTGKKNANAAELNGKYKFFTCSDTPLQINSFIYDGAAILISGNGSYTGRTTFYEGKFDLYQRTYACTIKENVNPILIYGLYEAVKCELTTQISGGTHGAAIPYIVMADVTQFNFLYNEDVMLNFSEIMKCNLSQILSLQSQLRLLTEARDRLLPKLMSGEIEV